MTVKRVGMTGWRPYQGVGATPFQSRPKNGRKRRLASQGDLVDKPLPEWVEQAALVEWARTEGLLLISIPNGAKRSWWTAQKECAMGLTKGVSDLFLAMPVPPYCGYWIEMKQRGKKPRPAQVEWMMLMREQGFKADYFDDWLKAKASIVEYLKRM